MREPVALLLALVPAIALADPHAATHEPDKPIDVSQVKDKLDVYRDEVDNYYVVPRPGAFASTDDENNWLFYGDGKKLYRQRIIGFSAEGAKREWMLWAPRAKQMTAANLVITPDKSTLTCRTHEKDGTRTLVQLAGDEAHTLLAHAKLYPVLWQRQAHLLARDDDGIYYYVDMLREDYGGNGYRVFAGAKGAMKELPMTNIVRDSSGEIFATKTGQLKLVSGKGEVAYWIKGGKKTELTMVDIQRDRYLIYRELGIYGQLGAVCDDL